MQRQDNLSLKTEENLAEFISGFRYRAYDFVMSVFPWGEADTFLEDEIGPDVWQKDLLDAVSEHRRVNKIRKDLGLETHPWRSAVASGHGVGKSAEVAWINYWLMSTSPDCRGSITANTGTQLDTRTWPELAKWHSLAINRHWFTWTASSFYFSAYPEEQRKNYMINAVTTSAENTEAFAGLHNKHSVCIIAFDEASGIESNIWEVVEGAMMASEEAFFFVYGNPTRPDGEFRQCFTIYKHLFHTVHVDSRDVRHTNKTAIAQTIDKYGIDSDRVKVRVLGQFPDKAFDGFIPTSSIFEAQDREGVHDPGAPIIMGVDVARFGDDNTVIRVRQGRDARSIRRVEVLHGSNVVVAAEVAKEADKWDPDAIVIESVGPGAGVIDILRAKGYRVFEVHPNQKADDVKRHANLRAEMWTRLRDWLIEHGCIDRSPELERDLQEIRYTVAKQTNRMQIEAKQTMKDRNLPSPDDGDSLALTFAVQPARRDSRTARHPKTRILVSEPVI